MKFVKEKKIIIIGGGLAGLCAAIHLSNTGLRVLILEKENFPHHKVCGEYLSKEILPYFTSLGIQLSELRPKEISRLRYSTPKGRYLEAQLPLGGFGISRYTLDNFLMEKALKNGAILRREKVSSVEFLANAFSVNTTKGQYQADFVLGAYGKRDHLDRAFNRNFFKKPAPWIAIKSHYEQPDFPEDLVALHNFNGGYCGLSKTESGAVNMCFLATYESFKKYKNPDRFIRNVLRKNPFLDHFFSRARSLFDTPLSIAQISFEKKHRVKDHVLMIGDSAGLIHPLCGNGMAMAIRSAKIASEGVQEAIKKRVMDREHLERTYERRWSQEFSRRLAVGKGLQKILLKPSLAEFSHRMISGVPFLLPEIIKLTHGNQSA